MDRWRGKTAVVTGAASGIGAAITRAFLASEINVVGLDIQYKEIECVKQDGTFGTLFRMQCNVADKNELKKAFHWVEEHLNGVQILVNNAGVIDYTKIIESDGAVFERLLSINVLAMALCVNHAVKSMKNRKAEGHIINVNSILGHIIPNRMLSDEKGLNGFNLYPATKHASVALTQTIRNELKDADPKIRVTSISPGLVETNIASHEPALKDFAKKLISLMPDDVADAVMYALKTRPDVEIAELTIQRTGGE